MSQTLNDKIRAAIECAGPMENRGMLIQELQQIVNENNTINVAVDAKAAINAVDGIKDLIVACIEFVNEGDGYHKIRIGEALDKIAERHILDDMSLDPVPCDVCNDTGQVGRPPDDYYSCPKCTPPEKVAKSTDYEVTKEGQFFNLDGVNAKPDIEEDLGRLLVEVVAGFDLIKNGPLINMPTADLDKMFDDRVWKLIPRIQTLVANRVMAKHPFAVLADLFSKGGMPEGATGTTRFKHACVKLDSAVMFMTDRIPSKDAKDIIDDLAYMATYMQVIMNLYGWTWDDVKLKARRQMSQVE